MRVEAFHKVIIFFFLLLTASFSLSAQKRKKSTDADQPQSIKERRVESFFTDGEKYFILEDYAKALMYYQMALEVDPNNATIYYKIAEVLSRRTGQEDLQKAALSIENALRLEKDNKYFYLLAASIYNGLSKFDKAAHVYEKMIETIKGTDEYLYDLAAVYQYANKPEEAIKVYNHAESVLGINEISSIQKQRLYLELGKTKEAVDEGEKLIAAFPEEERYLIGFAEVLAQKGERMLAIQYLEKFVHENPEESSGARMLLASLYRDTNQELKARELWLTLFDDPSIDLNNKVVVLGAYSTELNQARAHSNPDPAKEEFAMVLYEKLRKLYPEETNVHILGGDLYLSAGKNREAEREYFAAVKSGNVNFEVWQNLLYLETKLDQFDSVILHSETALELFPNQPMVYYFNGYANLRKHEYSEATGALEQAKKLSASNVGLVGEIDGMLGDAYYATKEYDKSDEAYESALKINEYNYNVLNNYSYYLSLRKTNLEKAERMSALLVKNNPDNPAFLDTYAWVLYARQKYREAKKIMERAITTGEASATHFEHYGDILYQLGDVTGAVQQWEKARGLNANSDILNKKIANRKIYE